MKKVIIKGYTITVSSWENDGDLSQKNCVTVEDLSEVKTIHQILTELGPIIGNTFGEQNEYITDYINNRDNVKKWVIKPFVNSIVEMFSEKINDLLGSSEHYSFRVFESMSVVYSPEDIYLEEIEL